MPRSSWPIWVLTAVLALGVLWLLQLRFDSGDVYPQYSSLLAEPMGAKLLHDTLAETGIHVARDYEGLERTRQTSAVIFWLGAMASSLLNGNPSDLETFEKAAAKGNRVVLGFRPASLQRFRSPDAVEQRWSVRIESRGDPREESPVYFASAKDWRVVRNSGGRATELERAFGRGSIVLLADGHALTNGGLAQGGAGERIAALLGTYTRAVFDEHHLGVQQSGSIMALARRYRLHGFFLGALVVAALFVWKSSSVFPPPPPITQGAALSGRDAVAGFVSLLRRNIPADEVAGLCWNEWRRTEGRTIPSARLAKADQIMKGGAGIENLNAAREVLYRK